MGCVEEDRNGPSESTVTKLEVAGNDSGALGRELDLGLLALVIVLAYF